MLTRKKYEKFSIVFTELVLNDSIGKQATRYQITYMPLLVPDIPGCLIYPSDGCNENGGLVLQRSYEVVQFAADHFNLIETSHQQIIDNQ